MELALYDPSGRRVATAAAGEFAAGEHAVAFDAPLPPGLYIYRLTAGGEESSGKLVVVE